MDYTIPRGTYDILPEMGHIRQKLQSIFEEVAAAYGYELIVTPIFEQSELFERSSGDSSDVVQKEMYRFQDRKGRSFALRPEGTAPVVRSYVENRLDLKSRLSKLYYSGPMFRYDRPQAGRYRQFYQYGIEMIGSNHPYFDAEVIALQWDFLCRLGLKSIRLEINSVGCPDCTQSYENALRDYYRPHLAELCPDCKQRFEKKPKRLLDCKVESCKKYRADAPSQLDYLDESCRDHFAKVQTYLDLFKVPYIVNPRIVRGLDYYSNTAFEFLNDALGAQNSIAGGGRYNALIEQIGGKATPAIGFAGGWERLILSLEAEQIKICEPPKPLAYLVLLGENTTTEGIKLLDALRKNGVYCEYDPEKNSLKAQMKAADTKGSRFALILGEDEIKAGEVLVKDLSTGIQDKKQLNDNDTLAEYLKNQGD